MSKHYDFDEIIDRSGLSTLKWDAEIARLGRADILAFGTADMDFRSPPEIIEALEACARRGHFGYPYKQQSYYDAIVAYFYRRFNWKIDRSWILGGTSVYATVQPVLEELTNPGDEIIVQTPVHQIFGEIIRVNERIPIENPLRIDGDRYYMDLNDLEKKITPRTKMLMLCNPQNPMGRVWSREELAALHEVCSRHGLIILADEIYAGLLYPGKEFTPMASVSERASLETITLTSASKAFNLTGLKHSIVVIEDKSIRDAVFHGELRGSMHYGGSTFGQIATEVAFDRCDLWSDELMEYVKDNYTLFQRELGSNFPELKFYEPESTYFAWVDFQAWGVGSSQLLSYFEDVAGIVIASGHLLGTGGSGHIRFNLGCPRGIVKMAIERLREVGRPG